MASASSAKGYKRHRPEQNLLYKLVERYYPEIESLMTAQGKPLPVYIRYEFLDFLHNAVI